MGDYIAGEYIYGLVMSVGPSSAEIRFGDYRASLTEAGTKWAGGPPSKLLLKGDLVVCKVNKADNDKKVLDVTLDQLPLVDAALICLESKTGDVKAMVGVMILQLASLTMRPRPNGRPVRRSSRLFMRQPSKTALPLTRSSAPSLTSIR